jgi:putative membrane protein
LKIGKSNSGFIDLFYRAYEHTISIAEAIRGCISENEYKEVVAKGNRASQLLSVQSRPLKDLMQ